MMDTYIDPDLLINAVAIDDKVIQGWIEDEIGVVVTGGFQPSKLSMTLKKDLLVFIITARRSHH